MWGITVFFNPIPNVGRLRLDNYHRFRSTTQKQGLNLCVVELVYDGDAPMLSDTDADLIVHVNGSRDKSVLWQKERLMNIALSRLPGDCDKVCWLDADLIFEDDEWVKKTELALTPIERGGLGRDIVQPFSIVCMLPRHWEEDLEDMQDIMSESPHRMRASSIFCKLYKTARDECIKTGESLDLEANYPYANRFKAAIDIYVDSIGGKIGMCWAARRELLVKCGGFYDCNVIGSGDAVIYSAMTCTKFDLQPFSVEHGKHIAKYLEGAHRIFDGAVIGCIDGMIMHMWHGKMKNRRYGYRHAVLRENVFDPLHHLMLNDDNIWEWTEFTPDVLKKKMIEYFAKRREST